MSDRYTICDKIYPSEFNGGAGFGADPLRVLRILIGGDMGEGILMSKKYVNQSVEVRKCLGSGKEMSSM